MKRKSGLADSPFFTVQTETEQPAVAFSSPESHSKTATEFIQKPDQASNGIVVSRYHDTIIESVRRSVKEFGKEAATYRFTSLEKRALANVIHALKMQGIRTSENEITRIAINFIIDEFNRQEKDSLLGRVLQELQR